MEGKRSNPCTVPTIKEDFVGDNRWMSTHDRYVTEASTSEVEVVFIGDSIVQQLQFTQLWIQKLNPLHCLNFGIGGDKVEHVLWRVLNGELNFGYPPKVVVLFVGTNNVGCRSDEVFEGIRTIVEAIREKLGSVSVVLPTLLPRGRFPNANRERNASVNDMLVVGFRGERNVCVVPVHERIVQKDLTISHHVMHDYLHLTNDACCEVFEPVYERVLSLLKC